MSIDIDAMERLANAGVTHLSEVKALIAEVRALRERIAALPEKMAIPADGDGFTWSAQRSEWLHVAPGCETLAMLNMLREFDAVKADANRYRRLKSFAHPSYNVMAVPNMTEAAPLLTVYVGTWEAMDEVLDGIVTVNTVNIREA
jgi:hypothetical protein